MSRIPGRRGHPSEIIDDRLRRYINGEPLASIAADHGVTREAIIATAYRHAPSLVGQRPRGPRPRGNDA